MEIRSYIETGKGRNWHKIPLQVCTELPPSTFLRKDNHLILPFIALCTPTTVPSIAITTETADQRLTWHNNQSMTLQQHTSTQWRHGFQRVLDHNNQHHEPRLRCQCRDVVSNRLVGLLHEAAVIAAWVLCPQSQLNIIVEIPTLIEDITDAANA